MVQNYVFGNATFTVPATLNNFAPETLILQHTEVQHALERIMVFVEQGVASAQFLFEFLKPGADPNVAGNWFSLGLTLPASTGNSQVQDPFVWPVVRIRVQSGGTAGTVKLSATAA